MAEKKEKGVLLVVSGPAGSGKGTVVAELARAYPEEFALSVSCTTRSPRGTEQNGKEYFFVSFEDFEKMASTGQLLEYARYCNGNYYGTPREYVEKWLDQGVNVILEIDVQGGTKVKTSYPDVVLIMLTPPDYKTLEKRLIGRNTDEKADIEKRLATCRKELEYLHDYDYVVVNEDYKSREAAEELYRIVRAEKRRTARNPDYMKHFYEEE